MAVVLAVGILLVIRFACHGKPTTPTPERFLVTEVIDGDTFRIASGDQVRLANIDTPEYGEVLFEEATLMLQSLLAGETVRMEFADERRDKYGRLVGHVFVDTFFVEERLVRAGLAYVLLFDEQDREQTQVQRLLAAQSRAIDEKIGLWAIEHELEPYYLAAPNGFRLHRPWCETVTDWSLENVRVFHSRSEALRDGLAPCRRCRP
jgi:endonuclease YncB( thermonuclease family)